jgi:4-amino-4-deoxy-L-arabinose transferase-like glycosyltransferase
VLARRRSVGDVSARGRLRQAGGWVAARPWLTLVIVVAGVVALRAPFAGSLAYPDEGGLLLVAQQFREGGPQLYGRLFVDRPPGLMALFVGGQWLGGIEAVRWIGIGLILVLVGAAMALGRLVGSRSAGIWTGVAAAALACNPLLGTRSVNAELVGAPLTVLGVLAAVAACRRDDRWRPVLLVAAGLLGSSALLVKQNLADTLVFGAVLLVMLGVTRAWPARRVVTGLAWAALGVSLPWLVTGVWVVVEGPGLEVLWDTLYGFRGSASAVIAGQDASAPTRRLLTLPFLGLASGLLLILGIGSWRVRRRLASRDPVAVAGLAMLAAEVAGVLLGGSYWSHYLVGLLPGAVLWMALLVNGPRGRVRVLVATVGVAVASTLVSSAVAVIPAAPSDRADEVALVGWLRSASRPHDTGAVTWGHPQLLEASGLKPRSPLIWSLPQRTLDPDLHHFKKMLAGRRAPTWALVWDPVDSWDLDVGGKATLTLIANYRFISYICDVGVYVRRDVVRVLPPLPTRCAD